MYKTRGANRTPMEDEVLCRFFMQVSVDSINGANQTANRLWEAVFAINHQQPGILVTRTPSSLQPRYQYISSSIILFVAKLLHAIKNHGSGTNELDWVIFVKQIDLLNINSFNKFITNIFSKYLSRSEKLEILT